MPDKIIEKFLEIPRTVSYFLQPDTACSVDVPMKMIVKTNRKRSRNLIKKVICLKRFKRRLPITVIVISSLFDIKPLYRRRTITAKRENFTTVFTLTPKQVGKHSVFIQILRNADLIFLESMKINVK